MTPMDDLTPRRHLRTGATLALVIAAVSLLAGCGSSINAEKPVGIGATPNTLKSSPCGCLELPNLAREA